MLAARLLQSRTLGLSSVRAAQAQRGLASGSKGPSEGGRDEYGDIEGKFVAHGEEVEHGGSVALGEEQADEERVAGLSRQSDERFTDEYPDSSKWVEAPGGRASAKWWRWKKQADAAMHGGQPEPGIKLE